MEENSNVTTIRAQATTSLPPLPTVALASTSTSVPIGSQAKDWSNIDEESELDESNEFPTKTRESTTRRVNKMGRCASAFCSSVTIAAFLLLILGISTPNWIVFRTSGGTKNPILVNSMLSIAGDQVIDSTRRIEYAIANYGLWNVCYRERNGVLSCSMIGIRCKANICWTRKTSRESKRTCSNSKVAALIGGNGRCISFQLTRICCAIAVVLGVFGAAGSVVAIFSAGKSIPMLAGIATFCCGSFTICAFVLVYVVLYLNSGIIGIARIGWSLWLIMVSGPMAMIVAVVSCCNASLSAPYREISDYPAKH